VVAGDPSEGQAFATGDAVNVAARLEQAAEPGEILLGPLTHQLLREAIRAQLAELQSSGLPSEMTRASGAPADEGGKSEGRRTVHE
jgi:class 3 adenylate cyclase